ncbi:hypothetical protein BKA70DRAFT_1147034 [Coprinopsis sp. MPI-PUGE-AT-0042]|nr:hypothetical protein BKA70DRAFT_1147034 [Coprinopsis sp. MPI-PUGE-AT-0042]
MGKNRSKDMKQSATSDDGGYSLYLPSGSALKSLSSSDIMYHVQGFLQPSDVLSLRKTSTTLYTLTRHRNVWLQAARNACHDEGIPVLWFPIDKMTVLELEHLSLSPARFLRFMKSKHLTTARPGRVQTLYPLNPFEAREPLSIRKLVLLPGGRFLLTESVTGLCLWDLGYNASRPAKSRPIAHRWITSHYSMRHPRPTPDGKGLMVLCILKSSVPSTDSLELYEIYPSSDNPSFVLRADVHIPAPDCVYFFGEYVVFASENEDDDADADNVLDVNVWDWANSRGCRWKSRDAEGVTLFGTSVVFDSNKVGKMDVHSLPRMKPLVEGMKWDVEPTQNPAKLIFSRHQDNKCCFAIGQAFSWLKNDDQYMCIWDGDDFDDSNEDHDEFEGTLSFEIHRMNSAAKGAISHVPTYCGVARDFTGPKTDEIRELPRMSGNALHWLGQGHIFVYMHLHLDKRNRFAFTAIPIEGSPSADRTTGPRTIFFTPARERTDPDLVGFCAFSGRVVTYVAGGDSEDGEDDEDERKEPEIRIVDFLLPPSCIF